MRKLDCKTCGEQLGLGETCPCGLECFDIAKHGCAYHDTESAAWSASFLATAYFLAFSCFGFALLWDALT